MDITWGTGLYLNSEAMRIKDIYNALLKKGESDEVAYEVCKREIND